MRTKLSRMSGRAR